MNYGMGKHIVFNSCLKTVLSVYVICRDPSIIALNTIAGTLAMREQSFMYTILYGQGSRELETYVPTNDNLSCTRSYMDKAAENWKHTYQ